MPAHAARKILLAWPIAMIVTGLAAAAACPAADAAVWRAAPSVSISHNEVIADDVYAAGAEVIVDGVIQGDLIVAGGAVTVRGRVEGDVVAVGGTVLIEGPVGQSLRTAGSEVRVSGTVGGDLLAAAGEIETKSQVVVGGETIVRGTDMVLAGDLGRELKARGENVTLAGTVHGAARLQAPRLHVVADAKLEGPLDLETLTPNPIDPRATLMAGVATDKIQAQSAWSAFLPWLLRWFTAVLVGLLLLLALPNPAARVADTAMRHPHWHMAAGLGVLFAAPLVAIMGMLTVVALPLGLMLMGLYMAALYLAQLVVAWGIGRWALSRWGDQRTHWKQGLALAAGLVVVFALKALPVAGLYLNFLIVLWGLGAITVVTYQWASSQQTREPAKPEPAPAA